MIQHPIGNLDAFDAETEEWLVVIETPKGCHNKYRFDERRNVFMLGGVLPEGMVFPYDFGFLPGTKGEDGDPLDVLLLMDEPAFCGCLVPVRLIGVIEAEQTETDGQTQRNDRLVAVPVKAHNYHALKSLKDVDPNLTCEIEQFFVSYNRTRGKKFKVLGVHGPARAETLAREGIRQRPGGKRPAAARRGRKTAVKAAKGR